MRLKDENGYRALFLDNIYSLHYGREAEKAKPGFLQPNLWGRDLVNNGML